MVSPTLTQGYVTSCLKSLNTEPGLHHVPDLACLTVAFISIDYCCVHSMMFYKPFKAVAVCCVLKVHGLVKMFPV